MVDEVAYEMAMEAAAGTRDETRRSPPNPQRDDGMVTTARAGDDGHSPRSAAGSARHRKSWHALSVGIGYQPQRGLAI
jgi:hypothetical protein